MTRDQALRKLRQITGSKTIRLEVGEAISSPERRAELEEQYQRVKAEIEAGEARVAAIIAANAEIQAIYARRKELRPLKEKLNWSRHYRKFEAMKPSGGIGWNVLGNGDTWEEVIEKATGWVERDKAERAEWDRLRKASA